MNTNNLTVTEIQRFCMHDGPGIRTVVFLKGCPLRCKWCHNPETQSPKKQILFAKQKCLGCGGCEAVCPASAQKAAPERIFDRTACISCGKCAEVCPTSALTATGEEKTVEEILETVRKDLAFYGADGGLTVSGGEPTFQPLGLIALLREAKREKINVCLQTCGACTKKVLSEILPDVDLFLFDVKDTDAGRLRENTGAALSQVIENLKLIDRAGKPTVLRCVMIPGVNICEEHATGISALYHGLEHCKYVELLPYHPYGVSKAEQMDARQEVYEIPDRNRILAFADSLRKRAIPVKCFGEMLP